MTLRLFLVAGEPSGDALGADLIAALRAETGGALEVLGVGGPLMAREGLVSLFPQDDLAVMGVFEVLPRLRTILRRIRETTDACVAARPAALVTIDSPSFGLRVAAAVRDRAPGIRRVHYVAPQVWAWRPGRAKTLAARVDHLLALLPFEPPWFTRHGLSCDFVGHPAASRPLASAEEGAALRARLGIAPEAKLLLALPGSRMGEVRRLSGPIGETLAILSRAVPGLAAIVPTVPGVAAAVRAAAAGWPVPTHVLDPAAPDAAEAKRAAFAAADAALAASGTISLELAAADVPNVSIYRANALTAAVVRRLLTVETANLVNLVAGERVIPEYLQEGLVPERVAEGLAPLLLDGPERDAQRAAFAEAMRALGRGGPPPSVRAARSILGAIG